MRKQRSFTILPPRRAGGGDLKSPTTAPTRNGGEINKLLGTAPCVTGFILSFEGWVFGQFRRADRASELEHGSPAGLVSLLAPWISDLRQLGLDGMLRWISADDASRLRCLINHALNRVDRHCSPHGQSSASTLMDLYPVEDILVFLALAESGLQIDTEEEVCYAGR